MLDVNITSDEKIRQSALTNTRLAVQELKDLSFSNDGNVGSTDTPLENCTEPFEVLPTPESLIRRWHRDQDLLPQGYINRHYIFNPRKDNLGYFQHLMRIPRPPQAFNPYNIRQHPMNPILNQDHTNRAFNYIQNQKINLQNLTPVPLRINMWNAGLRRTTNGLAQNQFSPSHNIPRPSPNTHTYTKPPYLPRRHPGNLQQDKFQLLNSKQPEAYQSDPEIEISIHDLTSVFYRENNAPLHFPILQTSASHNTDRVNRVKNLQIKSYRDPVSTDTQRSFNTNKRPILNSQTDLVYPRTPPKSFSAAMARDTTLHTDSIADQVLYDPERYPPSVSFGDSYYVQNPPIGTRRVHETEQHIDKTIYYKPNIYNRNNRFSDQAHTRNIYRTKPDGKQFSYDQLSTIQNLNDQRYQNIDHNSQRSIVGLGYAKLPNGYESPTTTFEVLADRDKQESTDNALLTTNSLEEMAKNNSTTLFNGHGGPFLLI